jgi:hypothetical protein
MLPGTTDMAESPETLAQVKVQRLFNEARAATEGVGKTAALWAAALVIVWVSSLEPTLRSVIMTARAFREINTDRQEAEGQAITRLSHVAADKKEFEQLSQFDQKYPTDKSQKRERAKLEKNLKITQKEWQKLPQWQDPVACTMSKFAETRGQRQTLPWRN